MNSWRKWATGLALGVALLTGCGGQATEPADPADALAPLARPTIAAAALDGRPLRVVATTSLVGDAVARVGGEAIALTTLMSPGQDPHSYQPGAADLTAASEADLIFVNGWGLEEGLVNDLANIGGEAQLVPISAGITPLLVEDEADPADEADHAHEAPTPTSGRTWPM